MLRLLRLISFPQLRASWGRTLLIVGGIANGVALMVAINLINTSAVYTLRRTIDAVAGPAQLQITAGIGELGYPESAVATVAALPGVAAAIPLLRATTALASDPHDSIVLFGADLTDEVDLARYPVTSANRADILRSLADPTSILVGTELASQHGLAVGTPIDLLLPTGIRRFTIRGLLATDGVAKALGGRLAVVDLPAAQQWLGKPGKIDQIDVVLRDGVEIGDAEEHLRKALPPNLTVQRPEQRSRAYEDVLAAFQALLTSLSSISLLAAIYVIYNTTSTAVTRRLPVFGQLRVLGSTSTVLLRLLMVEAFLLGGIGTAIGIVNGIVLSRFLTGMVSDSMGIVFQMRLPIEALTIDPLQIAAVGCLGVGAAVFASYFAARRASRADPLSIVRRRGSELDRKAPVRTLIAWWVLLVALAGCALTYGAATKSFVWSNVGTTLWNASVFVVAIPLVVASAYRSSRLLTAWFGPVGRVAADSVFRTPVRSGVTVATVAGVLTIGVTVATLTRSFQGSVAEYYQAGGLLVGDLVVSAVATEGGWLESPLPESIMTELATVPGVARTNAWRALYGQNLRGERIAVIGLDDGFLDPERYDARWYVAGDPVAAAAAVRNGTGINVAWALADRFDMQLGDALAIATPTGSLVMPIVGIVRDYMSDRGTIIMSRRLLVRHWGEASVSRINVELAPGASSAEVRARIAERFGDRFRLKILSSGEMLAYHESMVRKAFGFTDAIQLLIAIVTIVGIIDLLISAIEERRQELALWRVIGADEQAVRRSVVLEALTIGLLGAGLGAGVGFVTAAIWVLFSYRYVLGFFLSFHFALGPALWYLLLVAIMTAAAGYIAAAHATRQPIIDGLQAD